MPLHSGIGIMTSGPAAATEAVSWSCRKGRIIRGIIPIQAMARRCPPTISLHRIMEATGEHHLPMEVNRWDCSLYASQALA